MTPTAAPAAVRAVLALLAAAWWLTPPAAWAAPAEDPVELNRQRQIVDRVDALGDREPAVAVALDRLFEEQRLRLFVVYVRDFSGRSGQEWAERTAELSRLGERDILLAVASADRRHGSWADEGSPLAPAQLAQVGQTAIDPALRESDWAGAAIGAADGYAAVLSGEPVTTPAITPGEADPGGGAGEGTAGTGAGDLVLPIAVIGSAAAVAAYAVARRRRRTATRTTPQGNQAGWSAPQLPGPPEQPPLAELDDRARRSLVETDDAFRTSGEELALAAARFGAEATRPFTEAVDFAEAELTSAFRLRQQLDDAYPEDEPTRRRMLEEIVARCTEADRRLDAVAEDFGELRALEHDAPAVLAAAEEEYGELSGRMVTAEAALGVLRLRYAPSASAPVAGHAEQAQDRLLFAGACLDEARQAAEEEDRGTAAVRVRAAEGALSQGRQLMEAIDRRGQELAEAAGKLPELLSQAEVEGRLQAAPYDPLAALRRAVEASGRDARSLLDPAALGARASIAAAADHITTHRAAIGSRARTLLSEARRHLERARGLAGRGDGGVWTGGKDGDPQAALAETQRADALAREALRLATADTAGYRGPVAPGAAGLGGALLGGVVLPATAEGRPPVPARFGGPPP
ncbi:TPM domain-containing protein [Streptomyces sp. HNM0663]|uniref:TPM domain-containing protein n=1 Tax=Streptomyces chengmaiensis TaxID=3040919 RepID=A0ABT6HYP1_9ACTN|nr:TPM domain-containing protein [Streptomyces chengmaiensis]MDH2393839.1 TPM domain-containing protein [Streptomyces chengmaiensis]